MEELAQYTYEDFADSTRPYEYVYRFHEDGFAHSRELEKMSAAAQRVKFRGFKKTYMEYVRQLRRQQADLIYPDGVTQFEGQELELNCGKWRADELGVSIDTPFGEVFACNHPILPVTRLVNIDTGVEKLRLAYRKGRQWRYVIADKKTLASSTAILDLANVGVAVNCENAKYLVRYLHDVESLNYDAIPEKSSVSRLGWMEGTGFAPYLEDIVFDAHVGYRELFDSIRPQGSSEGWLETAREARRFGAAARVALAASFASVLVQPLESLPFFVHLWGGTESGKTVGLMLAVSVWANPLKGKYWHTFDGTHVGSEKTAGFLGNLPLALDELQIISDRKSFDKMIYSLSEGVGRTRGAKDGGLQRMETWANSIITTGEMPLTNLFSGGGAVNRIIEVECRERLFEDARRMASLVRRDYGWAGRAFVERLLEPGAREEARKLFDGFYGALAGTDTTEKQAGAAAILLAADALATRWIFRDGRALTPEELLPFLKTRMEVSVHDRAYEYLCEYVVQNRSRFRGESDREDVWGVMEDGTAAIVRREFNRICEEAGYNPQAFLSWLKQKGKLVLGSGKGMTKMKRINGIPCHCVFVKLPQNEEEALCMIPD